MRIINKIFHIVLSYLSTHLDVPAFIPVSVRPIPLILNWEVTRTCKRCYCISLSRPAQLSCRNLLPKWLVNDTEKRIQLRQLHCFASAASTTSTTLPIQSILTMGLAAFVLFCLSFPHLQLPRGVCCVLLSAFSDRIDCKEASCRFTCRQVGSYLRRRRSCRSSLFLPSFLPLCLLTGIDLNQALLRSSLPSLAWLEAVKSPND